MSEPISRHALVDTIENLTLSNHKLIEENDKLRGLLAQGKGDCVYCGLPAADIAKCPSGFPGCGRMDDIVNAPETKTERENISLVFTMQNAKEIILAYAMGFTTIELTEKAEEWLKENYPNGREPEPTV